MAEVAGTLLGEQSTASHACSQAQGDDDLFIQEDLHGSEEYEEQLEAVIAAELAKFQQQQEQKSEAGSVASEAGEAAAAGACGKSIQPEVGTCRLPSADLEVGKGEGPGIWSREHSTGPASNEHGDAVPELAFTQSTNAVHEHCNQQNLDEMQHPICDAAAVTASERDSLTQPAVFQEEVLSSPGKETIIEAEHSSQRAVVCSAAVIAGSAAQKADGSTESSTAAAVCGDVPGDSVGLPAVFHSGSAAPVQTSDVKDVQDVMPPTKTKQELAEVHLGLQEHDCQSEHLSGDEALRAISAQAEAASKIVARADAIAEAAERQDAGQATHPAAEDECLTEVRPIATTANALDEQQPEQYKQHISGGLQHPAAAQQEDIAEIQHLENSCLLASQQRHTTRSQQYQSGDAQQGITSLHGHTADAFGCAAGGTNYPATSAAVAASQRVEQLVDGIMAVRHLCVPETSITSASTVADTAVGSASPSAQTFVDVGPDQPVTAGCGDLADAAGCSAARGALHQDVDDSDGFIYQDEEEAGSSCCSSPRVLQSPGAGCRCSTPEPRASRSLQEEGLPVQEQQPRAGIMHNSLPAFASAQQQPVQQEQQAAQQRLMHVQPFGRISLLPRDACVSPWPSSESGHPDSSTTPDRIALVPAVALAARVTSSHTNQTTTINSSSSSTGPLRVQQPSPPGRPRPIHSRSRPTGRDSPLLEAAAVAAAAVAAGRYSCEDVGVKAASMRPGSAPGRYSRPLSPSRTGHMPGTIFEHYKTKPGKGGAIEQQHHQQLQPHNAEALIAWTSNFSAMRANGRIVSSRPYTSAGLVGISGLCPATKHLNQENVQSGLVATAGTSSSSRGDADPAESSQQRQYSRLQRPRSPEFRLARTSKCSWHVEQIEIEVWQQKLVRQLHYKQQLEPSAVGLNEAAEGAASGAMWQLVSTMSLVQFTQQLNKLNARVAAAAATTGFRPAMADALTGVSRSRGQQHEQQQQQQPERVWSSTVSSSIRRPGSSPPAASRAW
eukprot:gene2270-2582_t